MRSRSSHREPRRGGEAPAASEERAERRRGSRRAAARQERRQRARQRRSRRNIFLSVGVSTLAILLVISLFLPELNLFSGGEPGQSPTTSAEGSFHGATMDPLHIAVDSPRPAYNTVPPTSGPHFTDPAEWGIYDRTLVDMAVVHNLEHGAIVVNYNLDDPAQITAIEELLRGQDGFPGCFIMQPYPDIEPGVVALTAWQWLGYYEAGDLDGMQQFIEAHINRGPEFFGPGCGSTGLMEQ